MNLKNVAIIPFRENSQAVVKNIFFAADSEYE